VVEKKGESKKKGNGDGCDCGPEEVKAVNFGVERIQRETNKNVKEKREIGHHQELEGKKPPSSGRAKIRRGGKTM